MRLPKVPSSFASFCLHQRVGQIPHNEKVMLCHTRRTVGWSAEALAAVKDGEEVRSPHLAQALSHALSTKSGKSARFAENLVRVDYFLGGLGLRQCGLLSLLLAFMTALHKDCSCTHKKNCSCTKIAAAQCPRLAKSMTLNR